MTIVSSKEFNTHQEKYLDLALDEEIFVKRGDYTYMVSLANNKQLKKFIICIPTNECNFYTKGASVFGKTCGYSLCKGIFQLS